MTRTVVCRWSVPVTIPDLTDLDDEYGGVRNWAKNIVVFEKQEFGVDDDNHPEHGYDFGQKFVSFHPFEERRSQTTSFG